MAPVEIDVVDAPPDEVTISVREDSSGEVLVNEHLASLRDRFPREAEYTVTISRPDYLQESVPIRHVFNPVMLVNLVPLALGAYLLLQPEPRFGVYSDPMEVMFGMLGFYLLRFAGASYVAIAAVGTGIDISRHRQWNLKPDRSVIELKPIAP